ncbi:MAG: ABC transporter substrate-binding protein [Candidatus Baltobacteraceae bacterium]
MPALMPAHLLQRYPDLNRIAYNQRPVGAGPYRVVQWKHGDSITLEANPLYWRGKPQIAHLVFRIIPDANTRKQQLQTGETDAYFDVDPQLLPQVRSVSGANVLLTPVNDMHIVRFNLTDPVLADVRVRRGIALALDRRKIALAATHGASVLLEGDQPQTMALDMFYANAIAAWERLVPVNVALRRDGGNSVWENFEYFVVLSQAWYAAHPDGTYPSGVRRIDLKDDLLEADNQYVAVRQAT